MTARDGLDEGRRQTYLAALGIPLWTARQALPGALPSLPLEFVPYIIEAGVDLPAPAETAQPLPPQTRPETIKPPEPPRPERVQPHVAKSDAAPEVPRASHDEQERFPRVLCRVQALAPGWSAVVTLGDVPDLSAQEHRLLANIAQSLGGDAAGLQPCEHLRWPLNRNPALDHSAAAMVEWLAHALKLPRGHCLVFGEKLASYVRAALPAHTVIAAPLLADLLTQPLAKRQLWRTLHG